jgi:hypothetical protein
VQPATGIPWLRVTLPLSLSVALSHSLNLSIFQSHFHSFTFTLTLSLFVFPVCPVGGERSYTTVAFLLSLGQWCESSFRCMDEFDVSGHAGG